jgi:hypothetical protein
VVGLIGDGGHLPGGRAPNNSTIVSVR